MEITLKNLQHKIPIPQAKVLKAAQAAMRKLGMTKDINLSIVFAGAQRMRALNKKFLGHDYVTDVLTFDLGEAGQREIIICPRAASANARTHQTSTEKEIILYVIHGILHLAGYDDRSLKDSIEMRRMEEKLLVIKH